MKLNISIRIVALAACAIIVLAFIGYKYYEWTTLQSLASLYNQTWAQELGLVQDENKNTSPYVQLTRKVFSTDNLKKYSLIDSYNELTGDMQLVISNQENYKSTIQQNQNLYSNINTWFLFGQRGDFARNLVNDQLNYYKYEISDANMSDAANWLNFNVVTVLKDMAVVNKFYNDTSSDYQTLIPKYWSELSPLQKYTNSDFTFEHENDIKQYYPHSYAVLKQYQQYFADYYSTMQDAVNGDYQSVAYKIPTLQHTGTSLNVNFTDLFNETKDQENQNASNIIQIITRQSSAIKNFIAQGLYKYPLLPNITTNWKVDLVLCQMYGFKSGMYHSLSSSYVKSTSPSDLINELGIVSPNTQLVDSTFDKSSMKLINNDTTLSFTCEDKSGKKSYQFVTLK